ncbi:MAG: pseudaminic acid cytidylyltransferase [Bacteroidota bacterium]
MKTLAIITARGGSKRLPRKNIKLFNGLPIIAYPIRAAIESELFDEVMVSTDDPEIAAVAKTFGASVPFMRSAETAGDYATTAEVIIEVMECYESKLGKHFDTICCMYPTAPFSTPQLLRLAHEKLQNEQFDCVVPVQAFDYPIQRALIMEEGRIQMRSPEFATTRSQDLTETYHDSGQFYWLRSQKFRQTQSVWGDNTGAICLSRMEAHDIDTADDWHLAELKFKLQHEAFDRIQS